jgi:hypothetical protein
MQEAIAFYDIEYHRVSLFSPDKIINKIKSLNVPGTHLICVARGEGENFDLFENLDICESILDRKAIIDSAPRPSTSTWVTGLPTRRLSTC